MANLKEKCAELELTKEKVGHFCPKGIFLTFMFVSVYSGIVY